MKKTITIILILALSIVSLFAANVNILSKAPEATLTAAIQYDGKTIDNEEEIQINAFEKLDNPIYQSTKNFSILVNSNKVSDTNLTVAIVATSFINQDGVDSQITPSTDEKFK
ncbi:MAG: hypothetical protein JJE21_07040, partial [Spirochaetaceae bacterium]|nr:hypothetical protein [Spirochaetaceae bacterium]